jgi:hypothetical protein
MKLISVAKFKGHKHSLKVKCTCGDSFSAALDFRERYRKSTNLDALYTKLDLDVRRVELQKPNLKCKVANLSLGGLALSISGPHDLRIGDEVMVKFTLDDQVGTEIKRRATVRFIGQGFVGCQFTEADSPAYDKALGFYLMP